MVCYIKQFSDTANGKVNFEKLYIELKSSKVPIREVKGFAGEIYVKCDSELTEDQKIELNSFISAHDGAEPEAFDSHAIDARELNIRELNQLAIYSPRLNNVETVKYLTSIDNWINAYVRSGITDVIVAKISADAQDPGGDHFDYLHKVVNEKGNKTYEYFIGKITGQI